MTPILGVIPDTILELPPSARKHLFVQLFPTLRHGGRVQLARAVGYSVRQLMHYADRANPQWIRRNEAQLWSMLRVLLEPRPARRRRAAPADELSASEREKLTEVVRWLLFFQGLRDDDPEHWEHLSRQVLLLARTYARAYPKLLIQRPIAREQLDFLRAAIEAIVRDTERGTPLQPPPSAPAGRRRGARRPPVR
jgi:hypothetical protein